MNYLRCTFVLALMLLGLVLPPRSLAQSPPDNVGRDLRQLFLNTTAKDVGLSPSTEFPRVFGAALDWPIGKHVATVVSLSNGTASLYTTSSFGILGGTGHDAIRSAAKHFVSIADRYLAQANPVSADSPPALDEVRFYLLTYDGVRVIRIPASTYSGTDRTIPLFNAAQDVLTQLRLVTENQKQ